MRKQIVVIALAGSLGLSGAALLSPSLASAQTPSPTASSNPVGERLTALKNALKGLVSDKTLTQSQADKVASTLAEKLPARGPGGPGGHGPHGGRVSPEATAAVLGLSVDELRTQREAGKTLTEIAATQKISKADLIKGLVAAAEKQLAADVKAGTITQAQADTIKAGLTDRVTQRVDDAGRGPGDGGRRGHRGGEGGPDGDADDAAPSGSTAPSSTVSPSVGA